MAQKIYRSRKDRMIGGVCGGLAEYFNIDSTLVRLALLLLFFAQGAGLLVYIIAWIIVPEKPYEGSRVQEVTGANDEEDLVEELQVADVNNGDGQENGSNVVANNKEKNQQIFGIIMVVLGVFFLLENWVPFFRWERYWPLLLVGLGVAILFKGVKDNE